MGANWGLVVRREGQRRVAISGEVEERGGGRQERTGVGRVSRRGRRQNRQDR